MWVALTLGACEVVLEDGLSAEEAARLSHALDLAGVPASPIVGSSAASHASHATQDTRHAVAIAAADVQRALAVRRTLSTVEEKPDLARRSGDAPLVASRAQEQLEHAALLEDELSRSLMLLPGIGRARVHLSLPAAPAYARELSPAPKAAVLLVERAALAGSDGDASVRALLAGAVPGLEPERVSIVRVPMPTRASASGPSFVRVGPFAVARSSVTPLRAWLAAGFVLQIALAAALLLTLRRAKRRRHTPAGALPQASRTQPASSASGSGSGLDASAAASTPGVNASGEAS